MASPEDLNDDADDRPVRIEDDFEEEEKLLLNIHILTSSRPDTWTTSRRKDFAESVKQQLESVGSEDSLWLGTFASMPSLSSYIRMLTL